MKNTTSKSFMIVMFLALGLYYGHNLRCWFQRGQFTDFGKTSELDRSLAALRETGYLMRYYLGETDDRVVRASIGSLDNLFLRKEGFFHYTENVRELEKEIFPRVKELLSKWERKGVQSLLLPVPMKSSLLRDEIPNIRLKSHQFVNETGYFGEEKPELIYEKIASIAPDKVINLYEAYKDLRKSNPSNELFIPSDFHWTNFGAAQAVRLLKERALGEGANLQFEKKLSEVKYNYYLLNTFQLPQSFLEKRPELQWREKLFTIEARKPAEEFKRIVILGSSMCLHQKNTEFDFPHLVEQAFGMKPIYFCQDGAGLNGSLVRAVNEGFKLNSGDLLIWEFFVGDLPHSSKLELPELQVN